MSCVYLERKKAFMQLRTGRFMCTVVQLPIHSVCSHVHRQTDAGGWKMQPGIRSLAKKNIPRSGKSKHPRGKAFRLGEILDYFL